MFDVPERDAQRIMEMIHAMCCSVLTSLFPASPYISNKARSLTETTVTARHPITGAGFLGPHADARSPSTRLLQGPGGAWNKPRNKLRSHIITPGTSAG
jgi:hypothetical protein